MSAREAEAQLESASTRAILERAAERGRGLGVGYAGALTPAEAHRLHEAGLATIVDVRTLPEWEYVGRVQGALLVEWRRLLFASSIAALKSLTRMSCSTGPKISSSGRSLTSETSISAGVR